MAIRNLFPEIKPSLNLDFANTKQLDPRITFSRATPGTYYDGKTFAKAEENLLTYSQEFDNAAWLKTAATVTANATTAPDGTATADLAVESSATSDHAFGVFSPSQTLSSGVYALSVFVKASGRSYVGLSIAAVGASTVWAAAKYDLTNSTYVTSVSGTGSVTSASIIDAGGGWFRVTLVGSVGARTDANSYVWLGTDATTFGTSRARESYAGDVTKGIYIWGAQLEQRSTVTAYTPTTSQPITNYIPVMMTALAGVARFDHVPADNPITGAKQGESLGLLIEESRANLLTYSSDFRNTSVAGETRPWVQTRSAISHNAIIAPDGTLTGGKLLEDGTTGTHEINHANSAPTAQAYVYSIYAKAGERNWFCMSIQGNYTFFNLATGSVGTTEAGNTPSITPVGNGWYRCSISRVALAASNFGLIRLATADNTTSYQGNGYSGIYIWGAQLEAGAFATSYIPTFASQVTRAADTASMTGTNFSSWYRQDEGTLYGEAQLVGLASYTSFFFNITAANNTDYLSIGYGGAGSQPYFRSVVGNVDQALIQQGASISTTSNKFAGSYASNSFGFARGGSLGTSDTSGSVPVVSNLVFANRFGNDRPVSVCIKRLAYYPKRITDAQLQALTA